MTTEMSDNETVDDVLADMLLPRFDAITAMRANNYVEIKSLVANYRDRIKAAYKREVDKLNSVIQAQRSAFDAEQDRQRRAAPGNPAAMREALARMLDWMEEHTGCYSVQVSPHRDDPDAVQKEKDEAISRARAALSAPPRQCDVGTPKEQEERFKAFCASHWNPNNVDTECAGCPLNERAGAECEFAWAQMPYKEGENDGSK